MRRLVLPLGLAAIFFSPHATQAQPAPTNGPDVTRQTSDGILTLDRAIALATQRSFVLSAARHRIDMAAGAVRQADVLRNPTFSGLIEDSRRATRTSTASIDVPIELGGKRAARTLAAERAREVAQADLVASTVELKATVTAAYFDVLIAQERLALANDSAALATRGADAIGKRVAAGKVSPVDETRARIDQANASLEATEADAALQSSRRTLAAQWNDADPTFRAVDGNELTPMTSPPSGDLEARIDRAPSVLAGQVEVARQRALIDVAKSERVPDITVTMGAKRDNDLGRTQAVIGVSVPLPLFDRNQGGLYEAAKRADRAEDDYHAVRVRVRDELQRASTRLAVATRTAGTLKTVVLPAAEDAFRATSRGFEAGKFGFLDVIDAQRTLLAARSRYLVALSTSFQAATAIDRLLGR